MSAENTEKVFDNIPEGWDCANLVDCTTDGNISYGIVQPGQHVDSGIPIIRINNINNGHLLLDDVLKVAPEIEEKYKRTRLIGGEVLLTLVGSTGQSFVAPVELAGWNVPRAIAVIRPKEEIGADWINICLQSKPVQHFLDVRANTTVQKTLNLKDVRDIPIPLPPKEIKQSIESIALTLQNKIRLNRQINQTLEEMAQAIFKSWFVDFEPVKAKIKAKVNGQDPERAAMRTISGKTEEELDNLPPGQLAQLRTTAALFPDELTDSELGAIPKGWVQKAFGELLDRTIGGDWGKEKPDEKHTEKVRILRGTDLPNVYAGNDGSVPTRYVESKKLDSRKLDDGDIVIEVSGGSPTQPTGRSLYITEAILKRLDGVVEPASFCRLFRPKNKEVGLLLSVHLATIYQDGKTWLYQNQSTGISNFQTRIFLDKEMVLLPCKDVVSHFFAIVRPIYNKIYTSENNHLAMIRNTLLPQLLSGELEFKGY